MSTNQKNISRDQINSVMNLYSLGRYLEAIEKIKELNVIYPNVPLLFNLIGACYKEVGQVAGSVQMFKSAINIKPDYAEAHYNLGAVLEHLGRKNEAIDSYKEAIKILPNYPDAHNNLGTLFHDLGELEMAIESFEWAIAYKFDFAEAHNNLGNVFNDFGRVEDSINCFKKALEFDSSYAKAYFNLATAFNDLGNREECHKYIKKLIVLKPFWGEAHLLLSRIKKYKKNDPHLLKMHSIISRNDLDLRDKIGLNFALAHAYEKLVNPKEQFKYLNEANRLRKKEANYSFDIDQNRFSRIKELFELTPVPIIKFSLKSVAFKPIFIVGMPRSGTSLVHQIIASHSEVYGAGELTVLSPIINQFFKEYDNKIGFTEKGLLAIREKYFGYISKLNISKNIIVDKMPLNFRHIGFILSAMPEAKIIHMNRDPMATCWSIYKYYFNGNHYAYDQNDLANYYGLYRDLMNFWNKKFPNAICDFCYEDLTVNQEEETRKLLEYCELDWDENCIEFYKNTGAVKTTSALQVRQKMYQGSSEVWKKYEEYLQPLVSNLSYYKN